MGDKPTHHEAGKATDDPARAQEALADLDRRIAALRAQTEPQPRRARPEYRALSLAWRMILELTVGVCIGGAIGWGLDEVTGMRPLFLIVLIGFGLAAGIQTMMRSARGFDGSAGGGDAGSNG